MILLSNMKTCPNDNLELQRTKLKGVNIDECTKCQGVWFDKDELKVVKDRTDENIRWINFEIFQEQENKFGKGETSKKCPKDHTMMNVLQYSNSKITIEKCPECQGVWLDKDEFIKIIKSLEKRIYQETATQYSIDAFKKLLEIPQEPTHIVSEIQDFLVIMKLFEERFTIEHPWTIEVSQKLYEYLPFK